MAWRWTSSLSRMRSSATVVVTTLAVTSMKPRATSQGARSAAVVSPDPSPVSSSTSCRPTSSSPAVNRAPLSVRTTVRANSRERRS